MEVTGPNPDGPLNQNNEVAEGCMDLQTSCSVVILHLEGSNLIWR